MLVIIMGSPGSGKSSIGRKLAESLGYRFYDIDDHMPEKLKEKMRNNQIVSEEERDEYLKGVIKDLRRLLNKNSVVASLVLIKEKHRKLFLDNFKDSKLINLNAPLEILQERLKKRKGHFFNEETLTKFFHVIEPIKVDHIEIDVQKDVPSIVEDIKVALKI